MTRRELVIYSVGIVLGFGAGWYWRGSVIWGQVADHLGEVAQQIHENDQAARKN